MKNTFLKNLFVLGLLLLFIGSNLLPVVSIVKADIIWDATLFFNETGGKIDYVVFGEAPDANDGPPADSYDLVKPPAPPLPPFIRASFNDNLPVPYNLLWKDYRQYPGTAKVWNLTVQWTPQDYTTPTNITISWDPCAINISEYTTVHLCTTTYTILADMQMESSYTFNCPANIPQQFKIICQANQPPYVPGSPSPVDGAVGVGVNVDLSWVGGDPDPGDVVSYDVYFGLVSPPPKVVGNQSASVYDPGVLLYSSVYYWRVVSWDDNGASAVGPIWSFTTEQAPNQPPYMPSNPAPMNGATNVNTSVILCWMGGDPDLEDTVTYDIYFGSTSPPPKVINNVSLNLYHLSSLDHETMYYWKIVSWDNHGASTTGPTWHFSTQQQEKEIQVTITRPLANSFYLRNRRLFSLPRTTFVFGPITITAEVKTTNTNVERVEFYVDGRLKKTDDVAPYTYRWAPLRCFKHEIMVLAYDTDAQTASDKITVFKWRLHPLIIIGVGGRIMLMKQ